MGQKKRTHEIFGEFIDRYGPRLAHFNGVLQLFAQLGAPLPQPEASADG